MRDNNNMIPIERIVVGRRMRRINHDHVKSLAESIEDVGLINPITVVLVQGYEVTPGWGTKKPMLQLVAGNSRLEACKLLGWKEIPATIVTGMDAVDQQLIEIDENLVRGDLTHLERAEQLAKRKELYEVRYPETKRGACGGGRNGVGTKRSTVAAFTKNAAQEFGVDRRTIEQAVRRANKISPEVRDAIRDVKSIANNKTELDTLAMMTESEQKAAVEAVQTGEAKSVRAAYAEKECAYKSTPIEQNDKAEVKAAKNPDLGEQFSSGSTDWKSKYKHADGVTMVQRFEIRSLRNEINKLRVDVSNWKSRALKAETELSKLSSIQFS